MRALAGEPLLPVLLRRGVLQHRLVFDRSSLTRWRQRMGEEKLQALLQETCRLPSEPRRSSRPISIALSRRRALSSAISSPNIAWAETISGIAKATPVTPSWPPPDTTSDASSDGSAFCCPKSSQASPPRFRQGKSEAKVLHRRPNTQLPPSRASNIQLLPSLDVEGWIMLFSGARERKVAKVTTLRIRAIS